VRTIYAATLGTFVKWAHRVDEEFFFCVFLVAHMQP